MAAQRPVDIIFSYSMNGGSNWTSKTLKCADHRLLVVSEVALEHRLVAEREIVQFMDNRLHIDLTVDERNFTPAVDPNELSWLFMQKWAGARLRRISSNGVTLWGFTEFNSTSNTNYVTLRDTPDFDVPNSDVRKVILALRMAKEYLIT